MANKLSTGNKISVLEKKEIKAASLEPEALTHFPAKVFQSILTDTIILNNEIIGANRARSVQAYYDTQLLAFQH